MIYIAHDNDLITKVAIEPFAGCTAVLFDHPEDIITAPGNYRFRDDGIILLPELWAYPDRLTRMIMSYENALTLSETLPEILLTLKNAAIPTVKDPVNRVMYVYFNFVLENDRAVLESFGGQFENLETKL